MKQNKKHNMSESIINQQKYQHSNLRGLSRGSPQTSKTTPRASQDHPRTPPENHLRFWCSLGPSQGPLRTPKDLPRDPQGPPRTPKASHSCSGRCPSASEPGTFQENSKCEYQYIHMAMLCTSFRRLETQIDPTLAPPTRDGK